MARLLTMSTLVTRSQQRADMEGGGAITPAEWKALISEQYGELHSLVAETGLRYFETTDTIAADGSESYTEPTDMLSFVGIERILDGAGRRYRLREAMIPETAMFGGTTGDARRYALVDDQIFLFPKPSSGTYEVRYVPQSPDLSAYSDATQVDVVTADGEAFMLWGVTVKAKSKLEGDVTLALERETKAKERLVSWAVARAMTQPRVRVPDEDEYDNLNGPWNPASWLWR